MSARRGSTLVESSIVMMLFLVILIGVLDAAQILFFHQLLNERVRSGARYAVVHSYNASAIQNVVAYNTASPATGAAGLFGLNPSMVQVNRYNAGTASDRVEVKITGYNMRFLSPWLAGVFTPGPFRAAMPMESAGAAQ
jgi:TadE-like protein